MLPRRAEVQKNLAHWLGKQADNLNIFATYNLIGNAVSGSGSMPCVRFGVCAFAFAIYLLPAPVPGIDHIFRFGVEASPALQRGGTAIYSRNNYIFW